MLFLQAPSLTLVGCLQVESRFFTLETLLKCSMLITMYSAYITFCCPISMANTALPYSSLAVTGNTLSYSGQANALYYINIKGHALLVSHGQTAFFLLHLGGEKRKKRSGIFSPPKCKRKKEVWQRETNASSC